MGGRLGQRQQEWSHRNFVGRASELAALGEAGRSRVRAHVVFVHGPAGIGKTTFLAELAYRDRERAALIDAREVEPSPDSLVQALARAAGRRGRRITVQNLFTGRERRTVLIDHYEQLLPLDGWLRSSLLPLLPAGVRLVLASRVAPPTAWRAMPGWGTLIHPLPLGPLTSPEARRLLQARGVPEAQHAAIERCAHGHPLALVLSADFCAHNPQVRFELAATPDVVQALLVQLVQNLPSPAHRAALEACAVARFTSEPLLAAMLGVADAHEYFEWLGTIGFVQSSPSGRCPHDLVRDILVADLRWRNPEWHATLTERAHQYLLARLSRDPRCELSAIQDHMFLHRHDPAMASAYAWSDTADLRPEAATPADVPALIAMVARHEGEQSAAHAAHWFQRQLDSVVVLRDEHPTPAGFIALIWLERAASADLERDPATRAMSRYLRRHAPLRAGEKAFVNRLWMARDTYQAVSSAQTLFAKIMTRLVLTTPRLAYVFLAFADPDFWAEMQAYTQMERVAEADFEVDGRRYGVYGHDWRRMPPMAWLSRMAAQSAARAPAETAPLAGVAPSLTREAFGKAVRNCLRHLPRPEALRSNALLRCRMVVGRTGLDSDLSARIPVIDALVREAAAAMQRAPRTARWYPAIYRTYLQPAPSQALAAEQLGLPFSTYRRYLSAGLAQIVERLWQQELAATRPDA